MGFFSWITSDTHKGVRNRYSEEGALPVYVYCPDGTKIFEPNYEGYGVFGGRDIYALVAEWNAPELCCGDDEKDREIGIDLACYDSDNWKLKYPIKIAESSDFTYEELEPCIGDPNQGLYEEEDEKEIENQIQRMRNLKSEPAFTGTIDELIAKIKEVINET